MSDFVPDTPYIARRVCPECEPDAIGTTEVVDLSRCHLHTVTPAGSEDERVDVSHYIGSSQEAVGSEGNAAFCDWLHRKKRLVTGGPNGG